MQNHEHIIVQLHDIQVITIRNRLRLLEKYS